MKRGKAFLAVLLVLPFLSSLALSNGLNLNGLGSKAVAMGGAFVGLADDFSAFFWNPAGIAQFKQVTFGLSGDDIIPTGTYKFDLALVNAQTERKHYFVGMAAIFVPISENVVAGVGVYTPSGLGANWDGTDFATLTLNKAYEWTSKIGVVTISPALAFKLNNQFFIGVAVNINYGMFDISTHAGKQNLPAPFPPLDLGQQKISLKGWGYGATIGVLVKPSEMFSIGATFRSSYKVKFSGDSSVSNMSALAGLPGPLFGAPIPNESDMKGEVTWPMWLAGGVAFRPIENLTLTADAQYTNWKKIDVITFEFTDTYWQLITASSGKNKMAMHWRNATQVRFGAEYRINTVAIRGGYYFDPSPAPDETMNVLVPNYDFNAVVVGFGFSLNGLRIDFSLEYLAGKERTIPITHTDAMPGVYTMKIWAPSISIGVNL